MSGCGRRVHTSNRNLSRKVLDFVKSGGLAGVNSGIIVASYATGSVSGSGFADVGGLVGDNKFEGKITTSYATGGVSGQAVVACGGTGQRRHHVPWRTRRIIPLPCICDLSHHGPLHRLRWTAKFGQVAKRESRS